MRILEKLYILQQEYGEHLKIEASQWETEWGTTYYQMAIWVEAYLLLELIKEGRQEDIDHYHEEAFGYRDTLSVISRDSMEEAIEDAFSYYMINPDLDSWTEIKKNNKLK